MEAKRPWLLAVNSATLKSLKKLQKTSSKFSHAEVSEKIGWILRIRKATTNPSNTMQLINRNLKIASVERTKYFKQIGEEIFRPKIAPRTEVTLTTLGGFGQVGRSSMLLSTGESKILIDCGVNPGAKTPYESFPRLDWIGTTLDELDAVVIGHAHLDHTGFLPALCKYGYRGPIYCTEPTLPMMNLIQLDAIKVMSAQGRVPIYSDRDVKQIMKQTITLPYGTVTDISPDIKSLCQCRTHHSMSFSYRAQFWYLSGDIKFGKSILFLPRVETLLVESTYGAKEDIQYLHSEL